MSGVISPSEWRWREMGEMTVETRERVYRAAPALLGLAIIVSVVVIALWPSFASMASMWTLSSYGHGYAILGVTAALIWRDRHALARQPWCGSYVGLASSALVVLLWSVARATDVRSVEYFAAMMMINAAVWSVLGGVAYRPLLFPLAFLVLAVPAGDSLIPFLMRITADVSVGGLRSLGVPVLREGMVVTLPHGTFEIADVCSGFRYLNAGFALGVLIAFEMLKGALLRCSYVALVVLVFILTNGVRAFVVMLVASATHMQVLAGRDHIYFGWFLFLVAMLAMYWLAGRLSKRNRTG